MINDKSPGGSADCEDLYSGNKGNPNESARGNTDFRRFYIATTKKILMILPAVTQISILLPSKN